MAETMKGVKIKHLKNEVSEVIIILILFSHCKTSHPKLLIPSLMTHFI